MSKAKVATYLNLSKANSDKLNRESKRLDIPKNRLIELALDNLFKNKKRDLILKTGL